MHVGSGGTSSMGPSQQRVSILAGLVLTSGTSTCWLLYCVSFYKMKLCQKIKCIFRCMWKKNVLYGLIAVENFHLSFPPVCCCYFAMTAITQHLRYSSEWENWRVDGSGCLLSSFMLQWMFKSRSAVSVLLWFRSILFSYETNLTQVALFNFTRFIIWYLKKNRRAWFCNFSS